ncbi:hypothetical protein DFH09DRAFT_1303205 [Mycena vulgaris]|nr:hypothetical protein DFH09DRAFT_1303205 [Mycena vulgaris]
MRCQYYAMRVVVDDEFNTDTSPTRLTTSEHLVVPPILEVPAPPSRRPSTRATAVASSPTAIQSLSGRTLAADLLALHEERLAAGLPAWTDSEETFERRHLKLLYNYPLKSDATAVELMEDYEVACIKTGVSPPTGDDYHSVLLVDAEEQARRNWTQSLNHPVQEMILRHTYISTLPTHPAETPENHYGEYIWQTSEYQTEIVWQLTLHTFARAALEATLALPRSSYAMANQNLSIAIHRNKATTVDLTQHIANLERQITDMIAARNAANVTRSEAAIAGGLFADETEASQPPSYPGSPHSSDEFWEGDDSAGLQLRRLPPSNEPHEEDTSPDRFSSPAPTGSDDSAGLALCVAYTYRQEYFDHVVTMPYDDDEYEQTPEFQYPNPSFGHLHQTLLTDANPTPPDPLEELVNKLDDLSLDLSPEVQILVQSIEHTARVRPPAESDALEPTSVGLYDQPTQLRKELACLTAVQKVNGQFTTTNSITPEFAHATRAPRIKLTKQVTLQLGCVGSHSCINCGTRIPVEFGGLKGYYTRHPDTQPSRHYPNGRVIKALSVLEEAALIAERGAEHRPRPFGSSGASAAAPAHL